MLARNNKKRAKGVPKASTVGIYASVFTLIVAVVAIGYQAPQESSTIANATPIGVESRRADQTSVDEVVAGNIAAKLAQNVNLSIAPNVASLASSAQIQANLAQVSDEATAKPQILQPTANNRSISSYIVKDGDNIEIIAKKFGLSKDTIKWTNDLSSDAVAVGTNLRILPLDGIVYKVKSGDTVKSIAEKYEAEQQRIITYNDLEQSGLNPNVELIIPDGILPKTERPGYVAPAPVASSYTSSAFTAGSVGNRYAFGNCTYYAYARRVQLGLPVGSFWGNATTWDDAARSNGYIVDNTPTPGAILQVNAYGDRGTGVYGHVGIVESVDPVTKDIVVSDMNYGYNGFNRVTTRTISAGQAALYNYIH